MFGSDLEWFRLLVISRKIFEIFFPEFLPSAGFRIFGTKSAATYCRAVKKVIPRSLDILGVGEHPLQSLGTFYNGVKKLSRFEGRFFWPFGPVTDLLGSIFWVKKPCNSFKSPFLANSFQPEYPGAEAALLAKSGHFL